MIISLQDAKSVKCLGTITQCKKQFIEIPKVWVPRRTEQHVGTETHDQHMDNFEFQAHADKDVN